MTAINTPASHESSFACDESAPGHARAAIRALDPVAPVLGDVMLLASELVTNAVRHSGCRPSDRIVLRTELIGDGIRIEVSDPALSASLPHLPASENPFGGMGLRVVDALSSRWGFERDGDQVVWAEIGP